VKTKKAFITGISGQDGSLLAEFLLSKGYKVWGLMRENSSKKNLESIINNNNLQIVHGDLLNNDLIRLLLETNHFDEIYNLASQSNIRLSYDNPIHTFNVTLMGVIVLLENIKKYSPTSKTFQAGSSAMFGNSMDSDGFQRETTIMKPISPYASSKLFAHNICCNYRDNEGIFVSNGILYNHESSKSKTLLGVVNVIVNKAIEIKKDFTNGIITQFEIPNLKIHLDIGHAPNYIEGIWLTLQQNKADDYIISSGKTYSLEYLVDYIFSKLEMDYRQFIKTNVDSKESLKLKGDNSKLINLGWNNDSTILDLIDKLIQKL
jgi:GDPmannose 4,6-dehydratase